MTRFQMIQKIAEKMTEELKQDDDRMKRMLIHGHIGLFESHAAEIEEYYEQYYGKKVKIEKETIS